MYLSPQYNLLTSCIQGKVCPYLFFFILFDHYSHWAFRNWDNFKTVGYMLITFKISCVWAKFKMKCHLLLFNWVKNKIGQKCSSKIL